jgi:uncharacterized membrane protein
MTGRPRLASIDVLRGLVMVLMAVDHVRVYSGVPAGGPTPGLFFTRWITHFCAPVFVFLVGTSAFLHARQLGNRGALVRYLVTRGLLLVLLELTVIRASWTFGVDYTSFLLAGVIWMIGWCMVLLAALVWLPPSVVGGLGLAIVVLQEVFGLVGRTLPDVIRPAWELIYPNGRELTLGASGPTVTVLYTLVPWIGVMAAGFGFGAIIDREPATRRRWCLAIGSAAIVSFAVLVAPAVQRAEGGGMTLVLETLNQRKYPASVSFLLMTLGPAIALIPVFERAPRVATAWLEMFGRVPLFYYLLHIPLIHAVALVVWRLKAVGIDDGAFATAPYVRIDEPQRWSLPLLYLVVAIVLALLYPACRWFGRVKAQRPQSWLRYL